jgi:hypothetical protein
VELRRPPTITVAHPVDRSDTAISTADSAAAFRVLLRNLDERVHLDEWRGADIVRGLRRYGSGSAPLQQRVLAWAQAGCFI